MLVGVVILHCAAQLAQPGPLREPLGVPHLWLTRERGGLHIHLPPGVSHQPGNRVWVPSRVGVQSPRIKVL